MDRMKKTNLPEKTIRMIIESAIRQNPIVFKRLQRFNAVAKN